MKVNVIGYFVDSGVDKDKAAEGDVFLVYENSDGKNIFYEGYTPIGQHFNFKDVKYLNECTRISSDEYQEISKGYYTPEEYL